MGGYFFNRDAVLFVYCVDVGNAYKNDNAQRAADFIIGRKTKWKPKQYDGFVSFKNIDIKKFSYLIQFNFEGYDNEHSISFMIGELEDTTKIDYYKSKGSFYYDVANDETEKLNKVLEICYLLADPTKHHNSAHTKNLRFCFEDDD
jgi:hypothetical protein